MEKNNKTYLWGFLLLFIAACNNEASRENINSFFRPLPSPAITLQAATKPPSFADSTLVNIQDLDRSIEVNLAYTTPDNFTGKDIYGDLEQAWLRTEVAGKLILAQKHLKSLQPAYSLLVLDAARPLSVQKIMWDAVKGTDKRRYVAYPGNHSNHNYGAAVDLTLLDTRTGKPLDMGTPFDCFEELAWPLSEEKFLREGKLTQQQVDNRRLLRRCMRQAGFGYSVHEWWHFNGFRDSLIRVKYPVIP